MLELRNIKKDYPAGNGTVHALKGISLDFRKSEFVSILGPSGCGKTTMLNIIGGLDRYTSGDLIINGRSTKNFCDRDWDTYRNHSIGFVFQSYNLIPHQTVLQNVELALTLSGVSKSERKARAKKALADVGLEDQLSKKPNQLSGGQMQRVAIARALVNDPDIILADEPTGALDSETSVQVMEILKKISDTRLIIMVTHNPDLANEYSTRIIRMLDGEITDDSRPLSDEEIKEKNDAQKDESVPSKKKERKPSMSFFTSFMLSLKNLFTKKGRTALTAFAGSIGIIGIALILAISQGMTTYVNTTQENALASYPLTIERQTVDLGSLMEAFMNVSNGEVPHEKDAIYKKSALYDMTKALNNIEVQENDLVSFKKFLESRISDEEDEYNAREIINGIRYTYDLPLLVYTKNTDGNIIPSDSTQLMSDLIAKHMGFNMAQMMSSNSMFSMTSSQSFSTSMWQEMLSGNDGAPINDLLYNQYDVIYGSWPNSYDEIVLVVDENNELDDLTLYALGLLSEETIDNLMSSTLKGEHVEFDDTKFSYEEICSKEYKVILNSSLYVYDEQSGLYNDLRDTEAGLRYLYDNALSLKVSGIIRKNENVNTPMLSGAIGYTSALTKYIIDASQSSDAVKAQKESTSFNVIDGLPFRENTSTLSDEEKESELRKHLASLNEKDKASAYISIMSIPSNEVLQSAVVSAKQNMTEDGIKASVIAALSAQMNMDAESIQEYVDSMSDEDINQIFDMMIIEQTKIQYAQNVSAQLSSMTNTELAFALDASLPTYTTEACASYYDEIMRFSEMDYDSALLALGYVDMNSPSTVNIYASSFENKDIIEDMISDYNEDLDEMSRIKYTDYVGIMMSSVTTIINAITYVLIAFVTISLIVSSIMIGVITLISVQERTKEIGILRAIGASKKNVSSLFNAETMIIGFASGVFGVSVTYVLCIITNIILHALTGIPNLNAVLPFPYAVILVAISVLLTLISGIIPSRSAAKKDPVVALRTE